ncbi:M48 family metallopeptidase [Tianweitania populi]|uniref:Peptidase M48 domain-containing protein n=1 Tax=Tianweitania populi TaxID=1607949 RepID=A0A8J3DUG7_9HYPH|nr:M48 family metallopeptidase [Tianweitania populi]GHD11171.1 hypothetical protein GCM10016234_14010 [Tianweitania populi]
MQERVSINQQPVLIKRWPSEIPLFVVILVVSIILWIAIIFGTVGIGLIYALFFGLIFFFAHLALIMHLRGSAIQLGPNQFPEIYHRVVELSAKAGLKKTPDAYLFQADGGLNAFATKFFRSRIVTLYTDLLEACGDDTTARDMIIGHEIGHLRSGHLNWQLLTAPGRIMPFLGSAYSRACEFTCDRWGAALCGDPAGAHRGLIILAAGGVYKKNVNVEAYIAQQRTLDTGWLTIGKWLALYPPLSARVDVLSRPGARPYSSWKGPLRALGIMAAFVLIPILIATSIPFVFQPMLREMGVLSNDFGTILSPGLAPQDSFRQPGSDTDGSADPEANSGADGSPATAPSFASVAEMPSPQPAPTVADERLNELAQQCQAGEMQACDDLYNETDFGTPAEQYGNTCGGRLPENTEECVSLVAQ